MSNYGIYNRLLRPAGTPEDANNAAYDDAVQRGIIALGILPPGSALSETRLESNGWSLGSGDYPAFSHTREHNAIRGVSAGAVIGRRCRIGGHSSVSGITFTDTSDPGATELVRIGPGAAVSFIGCTFRRGEDSNSGHVYVSDAGAGVVAAVVSFVGCTFVGGGTVPIDNASGAAAKVQAIGCVNLTGNATLGTVTETGTVGI
jgi:hypothetical protein